MCTPPQRTLCLVRHTSFFLKLYTICFSLQGKKTLCGSLGVQGHMVHVPPPTIKPAQYTHTCMHPSPTLWTNYYFEYCGDCELFIFTCSFFCLPDVFDTCLPPPPPPPTDQRILNLPQHKGLILADYPEHSLPKTSRNQLKLAYW